MPSPRFLRDAIQDKLSLYGTPHAVSLNGLTSLKTPSLQSSPTTHSVPPTEDRVKLSTSILDCAPLEVDDEGRFRDPKTGRKILLKGINVDSNMKIPTKPQVMNSIVGNSSDANNFFFDGDTVSFVGRPFPLEEAELHFQRIKSWGFNTIRYLLTWEAIEHEGPGIYDEDFLDYTIKVLRILHKVGGLYVFLEMHQDVWSRFSGGSGAPMWTFYAAGLEPKNFSATEAVILHNERRFKLKLPVDEDEGTEPGDGEEYLKMLWTSNYKRLASLVMFTFFFAGKNYFPNCKLDGINIQDYLRNCYYGAVEKIWSKVLNELPKMVSDGTLLGFELMNEPNCGLVGHEHLGYIEASQQLRVSTTPTAFQTFKLGMGLPCEVDEYRISVTGPQKYGTKLVDPQGVRAWISAKEGSVVDSHYGWKRDPLWKLGECIFAQHNIWTYDNVDFKRLSTKNLQLRLDVSDKVCQLLQPNFFNQIHKIDPRPSNPDITKIDKEYFTNNQFIDFYLQHKEIIRKHEPSAFVLIQPPVLEIPPNIKSDPRNIIDKKTIYCPHYYDGMSLMFKTWNTKYNVDTLGIMRGKYLNPVLGIVFGEKAIRNCIRKQFLDIRHECISHLGNIPVLMSETGMPFDMNDKSAFETGKYHSQTAALDALSYAIEGSGISVTYWCYNSDNCHKWGDRWNNEDFSFWSPEDRNLDASLYNADGSTSRRLLLQQFKSQIKRTRKTPGTNYSRSGSAASSGSIVSTGSYGASGMVSSDSYKEDDDDVLTIQASSVISSTSSNVQFKHNQNCYPSPDGVRAVSAVVRPFVVATFGSVETTCFDLRSVTFSLNMVLPAGNGSNIPPTIIFVPKWHYPYLDLGDIYVTSGHVKYNETLEYLEWYHESQGTGSNQNSSLKSSTETIVIKNNSGSLEREESGIFPCPNNNCPVT